MSTADDIRETIAQAATEPKRVSTPDITVEAHSLKDQIEAAKDASSNESASKRHRGLRFTRCIPAGPGPS